jgi:hypothetical protein
MAQYNADTFTSGPAPAIHAGLNTVISTFTTAGTSASASVGYNLLALPGGAEVVGVKVTQTALLGTAGAVITVRARGGRTYNYMTSATPALILNEEGGLDIGEKITASATLEMLWTGLSATGGTGQATVHVITSYLTNKRKG